MRRAWKLALLPLLAAAVFSATWLARAARYVGGPTPAAAETAFAPQSAHPAPSRASAADPTPQSAAARGDGDACSALKARLCRELGGASTACAQASQRLRGAPSARCQSLLAHYAQTASELEDIAAALDEIHAKDQALPHGEPPQLGPRDAALTFVELTDFASEACGRAAPMAHMLRQLYPESTRVVVHLYPSAKRANAYLAAEASLAAQAQGKFWPYHDILFANPHDLSREALERYAAAVGLDLPAFKQALDVHTFAEDVAADVALAHRLQVVEAPSVFLNRKPVRVPYGVAELQDLVTTSLAK